MIDQLTLFTYLAIVLGFVFIPGPATILTLARATSSGTKVGVATGLGIAVGDIIHTAMAVLGLSAILITSAVAFNLVKYLGAAYLIYLGVRAIMEKSGSLKFGSTKIITTSQAFKQAVIAEVLNPKSAIFFLAFLPQFVRPENGSVALQLSVFGILFVLMGLFSTVIVALFAGRASNLLRNNPVVQQWQGKLVGTIYCAIGIRLALQEK